ncbi:MAG: glycerol-3-phosphate 1-O-acyltransferase PlsY [bacterium]
MANDIIFIAVSYLLGAVPFGWIYVKLFKNRDIRETGSGNTGATNVYRLCGLAPAVFVFAMDFLKGFLPVSFYGSSLYLKILIGFSVVLGHNFSVFLHGRGGKGVASGAGVAFALAPGPVLISAAVFGIFFAASRIISLSSLAATAAFVACSAALRADREIIILSVVLALFIFFSHRKNILRLLKKEEKRLTKIE